MALSFQALGCAAGVLDFQQKRSSRAAEGLLETWRPTTDDDAIPSADSAFDSRRHA